MSPAVLAVAVLLASVVPHDRAAAQSWVYVPPTNDSRLDFVCSSADGGNGDRYSLQSVDRDHITCNGRYTAYKSTQPLPAQQQIAFPYGQPARFGVAGFANNTDGVPVAGCFFIFERVPPIIGTLTESLLRVEFVFSARLGSNVTMIRDTNNGLIVPDCVFGQRPCTGNHRSVVSIVCGQPSPHPPTTAEHPTRA